MDINLKNLLLAGIGSVAYTYEKGINLVEELVTKGELTVNQGKELNEELKKHLKFDKKGTSSEESLPIEKLREILSSMNLATKQDLDEIKERLNKLENK